MIFEITPIILLNPNNPIFWPENLESLIKLITTVGKTLDVKVAIKVGRVISVISGIRVIRVIRVIGVIRV